MPLTPYLFFKGNSEEVLEHYRDAIGGKVEIVRFADTPVAGSMPPEWGNKVLHGTLNSPVGVVNIMDAPPGREGSPGDNFSIGIQADSETQAQSIFTKLSAGGTVMMPFEKTFWAEKFGMLTDKFGIKWMIQFGLLA